MYKYMHNQEIHPASGFQEARQQLGIVLPEGIDPITHFIVRVRYWDKQDQDYSIELFDAPGHQVFGTYDRAIAEYKLLTEQLPNTETQEVKLELIQYHRGKLTTYQSKILFPSTALAS